MFSVLSSGFPVDAANAAGITALSEAAAAGKAEAAQLLLDRKAGCGGVSCNAILWSHQLLLRFVRTKANPNTRGEFSRTPLWRAAYSFLEEWSQKLPCQLSMTAAGRQSDLVPLLLEAGGDPRLSQCLNSLLTLHELLA